MRSDTISPSEWRWVAIISGLLVAITLLPYAWSLAASDDQYTFMGLLSNARDGATYLAKIEQGVEGNWLFELRHTPQKHEPAGFHLFYIALGHIARLLGVSNIVIFHMARVATSFFMFAALYHFGATVWARQRPRRLFFLMTAVGSGLGWLILPFEQTQLAPDMNVPEAFPLLAAYTNPHFPLAIGCLALMGSYFIDIFRPTFKEAPTADNGGLALLILTIVLSIVSPPGALVMGGTLVLFTIARAVHIGKVPATARQTGIILLMILPAGLFAFTLHPVAIALAVMIVVYIVLVDRARLRSIPFHEARWTAMVLLPAFPLGIYYILVFRFNTVMRIFNEQNITPSPGILLFLVGYGVLLLLAVPGLVRAFRRFEPDGDQFMLCWFITNTLTIYAPFDLQRRMFIGLIIPVVYFAVRSLEDYWFQRIPERRRILFLSLLFVFILPTHAFTFSAPLAMAVLAREGGEDNHILLRNDYIDMLAWLQANAQTDEVVLASPAVSLWIPARTSLRVVYGHPYETVPQNLGDLVRAFYRGEDCESVFAPKPPYIISSEEPYRVKYIVWGAMEDKVGLVTPDDDAADRVTPSDFNNNPQQNLDTVIVGERLPTADVCRAEIQAAEEQVFGDVTLYILGDQ